MTVLVTGANGLVGRHLQEVAPPNWLYLYGRKDCDLTNPTEVDYMFKFTKPSVIVHLAADVGGIQYNIDNQPTLYSNNALMNTNIISSANKCGAKVLGMLSTCIYPDNWLEYPMDENIINEGKPAKSNYGYALSKRMMFDHAKLSNKKYGTKHSFLIPSNLYGKYDDFSPEKGHFISSLIWKIIQYKKNLALDIYPVEIWGDGSPLRQFVYAEDVARIIRIFVERQIHEDCNIAGENLSIKEMVEIADSAIGPFYCAFNTSKPNGQHRKDVSSEKLNKVLGYQFQYTTLAEGIRKVYDYINQ